MVAISKISGLQKIGQLPQKKLNNSNWFGVDPFMNAWVKVFTNPVDKKDKESVWMLVWVKNTGAALFHNEPYKGVPKSSLIYNCIKSRNPEKQKILTEGENILVNSYLDAKRFLGNKEVQSGFEITGDRDYVMSVRGMCGIEIAYPYVDQLLEELNENDETKLAYFYNFFKGSFVHEMTHKLRDEFITEEDTGQEIASHAVEMLSTEGINPFLDEKLEATLENTISSYDQDVVAALKVLEQKLSLRKECSYKPKSFSPLELNRAMTSIPIEKRKAVLKELAKEIINASPIELLRLAAKVTVVPLKKNKNDIHLEEIEMAS